MSQMSNERDRSNGRRPDFMVDSELARLLKRAGVGTELSYRDAARITGVSHGTIERLYQSRHIAPGNEDRPPRPATIAALAKLPGVGLDELRRAVLVDIGYITPRINHDAYNEILTWVRVTPLTRAQRDELMLTLVNKEVPD